MFGGKVKHVDDSAAKAVPGVRQVVVLDDLVAVVGDHMWAAKQGLDALDDHLGRRRQRQGQLRPRSGTHLRAASKKDGVVAKSDGDVDKGLAQGERLDADYELPFLAHATMEPMNCTVHLTPGACEIWIGTQVQTRAQEYRGEGGRLPIDKVTVQQPPTSAAASAGRLEPDMVENAVRIAKQVDGPVKVVWTREEDIQHDVYRPVYRDTISASLQNGKIVAWKYRVTGSSVMARWLPPLSRTASISTPSIAPWTCPTTFPTSAVEYVRAEPPAVPTGFWRGVGPNNNVFAIESFMDELARKAGKDPIAFRLGMLDGTPRLKAALQLVADKSGWGKPLPARTGRGVARSRRSAASSPPSSRPRSTRTAKCICAA